MRIPVVVFHVFPSKLYGLVFNHIHASLAQTILKFQVTHSGPLLFTNVNVGGIPSYTYTTSVPVAIFHAKSFTVKFMVRSVLYFKLVI